MASRPAAKAFQFPGAPGTMMPFLYQTRTLSSMQRAGPTCLQNCRHAQSHRAFSSNLIFRYVEESKSFMRTSGNISEANKETFTIRRTPYLSRRESEPVGAREIEYFQDRPRGNETSQWRVGQGVQRKPRHHEFNMTWDYQPTRRDVVNSDASYKLTGPNDFDFRRSNIIDFVEAETNEWSNELGDEILPAKDEITQLTGPRFNRESTITDSERYAFQRIFSDIFARKQRTEYSMNGEDTFTNEDRTGMAIPNDRQRAKLKLDNILSNAMQRQPRTRQEMEEIVNEYPTALRAAAARAIGMAESASNTEEAASKEDTVLFTEELETLREPERMRIETLMKGARTDFELWDVMEKEVFSLIHRLGLGDVSEPDEYTVVSKTKKKKKNGKNLKEVKPKHTQTITPEDPQGVIPTPGSAAVDSKNGISPLVLYGPLYPSSLLLGLRLLDRSFVKTSPLALSLVPKIKSLGLMSHVLGATTQLYNELLQIYRSRYDDYRGILKLLEEMEHAGLDLDEETLRIVTGIRRTQASVQRGEKGKAVQALWNLPEFGLHKFGYWKDKIVSALHDREQMGKDSRQIGH